MKKYLSYEIQGSTAFASGYKMSKYPSNRTIEKLRNESVRTIIWRNGDFIHI